MKYSRFEELPVWISAIEVTTKIYDITSRGSWSKDFGLRDQIRRATVSISSNIVEGFEKNSTNELIRYLRIAKGSTGEVRNQLYIARNIGYVSTNLFEDLNDMFLKLGKEIGGFIRYLDTYRKSKAA
ncbi:MAG: four helix bundle protein [Patescibacteria group bacterium]|jgi:four helix bundle protein